MLEPRSVRAGGIACVVALVLLLASPLVSGAQAVPDTSTPNLTLRLDSGPAPLIANKRVATLAQGDGSSADRHGSF
jgi:hypothetical protein